MIQFVLYLASCVRFGVETLVERGFFHRRRLEFGLRRRLGALERDDGVLQRRYLILHAFLFVLQLASLRMRVGEFVSELGEFRIERVLACARGDELGV